MDNNSFFPWVEARFGADVSSECQFLMTADSTISEKTALSNVLSKKNGEALGRQRRTLDAKGNSYIPDDAIIYDMSVLDEPL